MTTSRDLVDRGEMDALDRGEPSESVDDSDRLVVLDLDSYGVEIEVVVVEGDDNKETLEAIYS
jgi:hypothetical protein